MSGRRESKSCSEKKKIIRRKKFRRERKEKGKIDSPLNHFYIGDEDKGESKDII